VLGATTAEELFGRATAVGQTVAINGIPMQVIGELAAIGSSSSTNDDDTAIVPITTAQTRLIGGSSRSSVSTIYVEAQNRGVLSAAYQEADAELNALHGTSALNADFTIASQQSILTTATSVDKTLTILLAGIAAISLLVGGIGVMNIMLVSVTERIKEIGLRKALGAPPRVIRRQFLVESSVLGLAGGLLGVGLGLIGAACLPSAIGQPIAVSGLASVGAIAVAVAIGVIFGVYPASRAARLAPIDALRSE
jgi:putative ABC transport system permease protein